MKPIYSISILILISFFSVVIGHLFPPNGILISPIVMIGQTVIIVFNSRYNVVQKALLCYLFIGTNDIGIKLFAGGYTIRWGWG